ncbi:hypothetical protein DFH09DRAFT_1270810 [Mycena vulgaris]|nr:hypothetical protein DFH09DRAFT_1270810 [Mycena vulgaris]
MSTIPLLSVHLAVAVLESFLYGIYVLLSLFIVTRHRESLKSVSPVVGSRWLSPVALATLSLFVMVTVSVQHWVLTVVRLFLAFTDWEDGPGPRIFYSDLSHRTEVLKHALLTASIYPSSWVLWECRTRIIVLPAITLMGLVDTRCGKDSEKPREKLD